MKTTILLYGALFLIIVAICVAIFPISSTSYTPAIVVAVLAVGGHFLIRWIQSKTS